MVFAKPRLKHQPSQLFVLSGRKDGAVVKHMSFQTFTLTVTSSKEPLRMTMVNPNSNSSCIQPPSRRGKFKTHASNFRLNSLPSILSSNTHQLVLIMNQVWMDPPAAPSSLHPMVNDLNLKAQSPNGKNIYPNSLNEEDSINNVEVIHGESSQFC